MNPQENIFVMSDAELQSLPDTSVARSIFFQFLRNLQSDIEVLQAYFTDMTARSAVFLTVASLLTFLPINNDPGLLKHFLIWVFPFLLIGIVCFVLSSIRIQATRQSFNVAVEGTPQELIVLRLEVLARQDLLKRMNDYFNKCTFYYRWMLIFVLMYLLAFVLHYYVYVFYQVPSFWLSMFLTILVADLGIWGYLVFISKSVMHPASQQICFCGEPRPLTRRAAATPAGQARCPRQ